MDNNLIKICMYGILFGIPFCLAVGPVFILLIQASVNRGAKLACSIIYGVLAADCILIISTYFFIDSIRDFILEYSLVLRYSTALLLFLMGLHSVIKTFKMTDSSVLMRYNVGILYATHGFCLDLFSPTNFLVWSGVNASLLPFDNRLHIAFYISCLLTIGILMLCIVRISVRLGRKMHESKLKRLDFFSGIVYMAFSFYILFGGKLLRMFL